MPLLEIVRWVATILLGAFCLFVVVMNFGCFLTSILRKEHHSVVPFVGGISGCLAMLACPVGQVYRWAWIPLVLDLGSLFMLAGFAYAVSLVKRFK